MNDASPAPSRRGHASAAAASTIAALLVGACGTETTPTGSEVNARVPTASASVLAEDDTTTLGEAQRLASSGEGAVIGAALPGPLELVDASEPADASAPSETPSTADNAGESVEPTGGTEGSPATAEPSSTDSAPEPATPTTEGDGAPLPASEFSSSNTPGFVGKLLDDGTVRVRWVEDESARGYNVYRQGDYVATVFDEEYVDADVYDDDYYYEIEAFDYDDRFTRVATGLTVRVRGLGRTDPDAPASNAALLEGYELVFSDEFDTGALDTTKWNTSYLWGPDLVINSEEQYYVDIENDPEFGYNPFTFEDGALVIETVPTPDELLEKANGQRYLSGMITSYDSLQFTYGYAEARVRVPYGRGYWPAFWLLNAYYVDDMPEIDIMEFLGHDQDTVFHTYHYYDAEGTLRSTESEPTQGIDFTADFHTFAVDWRPGLLVYYVDGVEVHRIADPKISRQDMYVIANTAIGGWWPGPPDATTPFPGRYAIDYIRVYRQVAPYGDPPFSDDDRSGLAPAPEVPGASPNHRPPFYLWPEGYPEGR